MLLNVKKKMKWDSDSGVITLEKVNSRLSVDRYLTMACDQFTVLGNVIRSYGDQTLSEYIDIMQPHTRQAFQSIDDLLEIIGNCVTPLLGKSIAKQTTTELERSPIVLTANHHGVSYFAQDFQGGIIFALNKMFGPRKPRTVPIFSCGTVPLDNLTYPLGLLFYRTRDEDICGIPKKIPLFSNKMRRQIVSCARPFDEDMVTRAQQRVKKMVSEHMICPTLDQPIQTLLNDEYRRSLVFDLPSYSQQSVVLNNAIWKRIFKGWQYAPEIVNLELEKISTAILEKDIKNANSLASCVMFDPRLRNNIFQELDGKRACWQTKALLRRLHADCSAEKAKGSANGCGTMLFWGIDDRGRQVPLYLKNTSTNNEKLCGIDDRGNVLEMPYSAKSIGEGLVKGKLLPSIFTSFLVISLARGVACAGGYFQCEYLPAMQRGLVKALKKTGGYDVVAQRVSNVITDTYLSGMIAVMSSINNKYLVPAGPIEIIASGGLDEADIARLQSLTIRDAHLSALSETLQDLPVEVKNELPSNWKTELAGDNFLLLKDKVAIK